MFSEQELDKQVLSRKIIKTNLLAKPNRALELHYSMIQFLILRVRLFSISEETLAKGNCSL